MAFVARPRSLNTIEPKEIATVAHNLLELRTVVTQFQQPPKVIPLHNSGPSLAKLYYDCTSRLDLKRDSSAMHLSHCEPMIFIELSMCDRFKWKQNSGFTHVKLTDINGDKGGDLWFTWILNHGRRVGVWVSNLASSAFRESAQALRLYNLAADKAEQEFKEEHIRDKRREIRLNLLRVHAHRQVIRAVLGGIISGIIKYKPKTSQGDALEEYLNDATWILNRNYYRHLKQTPIRDALQTYDDFWGQQERDSLAHQLTGMRRQIFEKLKSLNSSSSQTSNGFTVFRGNLTLIKTHMETKISFGDGNTFHGNVIIADRIQNSFNKASQTKENEPLKRQLEALVILISKLTEKLDEEAGQQASRKLQAFVEEASSFKPDSGFLKLTGEGLVKAAKAVAEMTTPVTSAVKAILALYET